MYKYFIKKIVTYCIIFYFTVFMASSSSSSSNIKIKSDPVDGDVLWMQDKHVSQHIWNEEEDRKLHIRRVVPTYQGQEEISDGIVPLFRQSGFYWIMKMRYLAQKHILFTWDVESVLLLFKMHLFY